LDTEAVAVDYRNQFLHQIDHNAKWYGNSAELVEQHKILQSQMASPWYSRWFPKFQQSIS
jgi:hypothetical protein